MSGEGADTIYNYSDKGPISINTGEGDDSDDNDYVYVEKGDSFTFYGGKGNDVVTLNSTNGNNKVIFREYEGDDTIYGWRYLNGADYEIWDETGTKQLVYGDDFATYDVGRNRRDLLVKLKKDDAGNKRGSILFVDVLEPVLPFDTVIAVTIDNKTEFNAKVTPNDKKPSFYSLESATTLFSATGDVVTMQNDGSSIIVKGDGSKATVGSYDDMVTLKNENDPTVYYYNNFKELKALGIETVGVGIGTIVGSGMKSTNFTIIDEINGIKLKESVRGEILEEDISTITRTNGITITGNEIDNLIIGGKGNDYITGEDGNDTLEGGAGNDTLKGHLIKIDLNDEIIYESKDDSNTFVFRSYRRKDPYMGDYTNRTTILDYIAGVDEIKIAEG